MPEKKLSPKFKIGQLVKEKGTLDNEAGKIIKLKYDSDLGFIYIFASKEYLMSAREFIHGTKTCLEKDVEAINVK